MEAREKIAASALAATATESNASNTSFQTTSAATKEEPLDTVVAAPIVDLTAEEDIMFKRTEGTQAHAFLEDVTTEYISHPVAGAAAPPAAPYGKTALAAEKPIYSFAPRCAEGVLEKLESKSEDQILSSAAATEAAAVATPLKGAAPLQEARAIKKAAAAAAPQSTSTLDSSQAVIKDAAPAGPDAPPAALVLRAPLPRPSLHPYEVLVTRRLPLIVYFKRCMRLLYEQNSNTCTIGGRGPPSLRSKQRQAAVAAARTYNGNNSSKSSSSTGNCKEIIPNSQKQKNQCPWRFPFIIIRGAGGCMRTAVWLAQDVVKALGGIETKPPTLPSSLDKENFLHSSAGAGFVSASHHADGVAAENDPAIEDGVNHPCIAVSVSTYTVSSTDTVWETPATADEPSFTGKRDDAVAAAASARERAVAVLQGGAYNVKLRERLVSGIAITIKRCY